VYVLHAHTEVELGDAWEAEWRIDHSNQTMTALTLVGMQGVINRYEPRIYLDWNEVRNGSGFWLSQIDPYVDIVDTHLSDRDAVAFLFQEYGALFTGAVVYDPDIPDTINVATMIAGLENRVMLSPQQLDWDGIPEFASVLDLRTLATEQGWNMTETGTYELYEWVYDTLWPRLDHRIIGIICPGPPTSWIPEGEYFPLGLAARDYIVALNLTAL
jgi:hypothetical protein